MENILVAARKVFVRKGFARATVDDITAIAKVAHGTFYRYFRNKQDVLAALVSEASDTVALPRHDWGEADLYETIRGDITIFFERYHQNPDLVRIWTEAASHDKKIAETRRKIRESFVQSVHKAITEYTSAGHIPPLDADIAARALTSMLDHFAYVWFVEEERDESIDDVAHTVALLWSRSLGAPTPST